MTLLMRDQENIERGIELGMEQGMEQGIKAFILDNIEEGKPEEIIIKKLRKRFGLEESTAKECFDKCLAELV